MSEANRVSDTRIDAEVRTYGAIGEFEAKTFWFMLGAGTPDQRTKEAIRVLQQIGLEPRKVVVQKEAS